MAPETIDLPLPINRDEALERVGGDEDFLNELLSLYDEEYANNSKALAEAIAQSNFKDIRELGHSIKGASANLSLPGLRAAAFDMEKAGEHSQLDQAKAAMERLVSEYERLKKFLAG